MSAINVINTESTKKFIVWIVSKVTRKKIFGKLIITQVSILMLAFIVTGSILYYSLTNSVSETKVKSLVTNGYKICDFWHKYIIQDNNPISIKHLDFILGTISENEKVMIWISDSNGYLIKATDIPNQVLDSFIKDSGYYRFPDSRQYLQAFSESNKGYIKLIGDFYGLFRKTKEVYLTIEIPITQINYNGDKQNIGVIYLITPLPGVYESRKSTFEIFIFSVIIAIIFSTILIYLLSQKLSKPIKMMNENVKQIALGNFDKQLIVSSNDEIGELSKNFSNMVKSLHDIENNRRRFVSNVSHEFRTPMTSIKGFIDAILDGIIPAEKEKTYLSIIKDEINRLSLLTNQLLGLTKYESGEIYYDFKKFDINELIRRCIIKFESILSEKEINVDTIFKDEILLVNADQNSIEQVITNLMHNATKFTMNYGIIKVKTQKTNHKVVVSIEDNGIGIPENELNSIWERFYKTDKSRNEDKTGVGLGLSIVKEIIKAHNQNIWVESKVGYGTAFHFTLESVNNN